MAVDTHCLPAGKLGVGEIPVSNVASANISTQDPGVGNRRGIIVFMHGLTLFEQPVFPIPIPNINDPGFYTRLQDFATIVVNDGWVFCYMAVPEDFTVLAGNQALYNDIANDAGNGSRFWNHAVLNWWDHVVAYLAQTYGANRPIIVGGFSLGGYKSIRIATNYATRAPGTPIANLVGYMPHVPVAVLENADILFTGGVTYYSTNCSGFDYGNGVLNNTTIPGIVGYGTNDEAIGWASASVAAGSASINVNTFTGSGILNVSANNFIVGAQVTVFGLTGGTGQATIGFTGTGSGTLTNCTTVAGSGTLQTGLAVVQNYTDQIITHAQAVGQPVIRNATNDAHEYTGTPGQTTTLAAVGSIGTLLSSSSVIHVSSATGFQATYTIAVTNLSGGTGSALITCTGTGTGTLNGCTVLCGSGTIQSGTAFTQSNDAATYAAWIAATIDPNYPVSF